MYLFQDICKSCGAFGRGEEGKMIVCTQCGQCYHPYCASVKVNVEKFYLLIVPWCCFEIPGCALQLV